MKKILVALIALNASVASAVTTTTEVSRLKLVHPDFNYDGGTGLHTLLRDAWTKIGENINSRYETYSAIADSGTVELDHNFGVDLDQLNVLIYTGTHPNFTTVADPANEGWTIQAKSGSEKTVLEVIAPSSGGPHTFAVVAINGVGGGAEGDLSFKLSAVTDPNAVIKGGYLFLDDGRELATNSAGGTDPANYGVDLTVSLDTIFGSGPAASTTYYLYVDTDALGAEVTLDNGRRVYAVGEGQLAISTTEPEAQTLTRYVPLAFIQSTAGSAWGEDFSNLALRRHDNVNVPVETYTTGRLTAAPSFPLAHGLASRPKSVKVITQGQTVAGDDEIRFDLCEFDDTNINCDLSSLTIDVSHEVEIVASAANDAIAIEAASATKSGIVTTSAQTLAGDKTLTGSLDVGTVLEVGGNVGIGSSSQPPIAPLDVSAINGNSRFLFEPSGVTNVPWINAVNGTDTGQRSFGFNADNFRFYLNGTEAMRLDSTQGLRTDTIQDFATGGGPTFKHSLKFSNGNLGSERAGFFQVYDTGGISCQTACAAQDNGIGDFEGDTGQCLFAWVFSTGASQSCATTTSDKICLCVGFNR